MVVVVTAPAPWQRVEVAGLKAAILTVGVTVTSSVSVNCIEQLVVALVANTLKVVVAVKFPVGKLIVPPSPATAVPTLVVPVRNW